MKMKKGYCVIVLIDEKLRIQIIIRNNIIEKGRKMGRSTLLVLVLEFN